MRPRRRGKKRVGLKVYTDSGPGLATPIPLVKAVIAALERRGFENRNIFLVGLNQLRLRMTGYLPSLVTGQDALRGQSGLCARVGPLLRSGLVLRQPAAGALRPGLRRAADQAAIPNTSTKDEDRKSFLATPLFLDADFWINLPVYTDHPVLGVNGALVNATLWNASNTARFFRSPANAPAAVAEMSAIPELRETWVFTIASLEIYQYIGGPFFNSLYTASEPLRLAQRRPGDAGRPDARPDEPLAPARRLRGHLRRYPHARIRRDPRRRLDADEGCAHHPRDLLSARPAAAPEFALVSGPRLRPKSVSSP